MIRASTTAGNPFGSCPAAGSIPEDGAGAKARLRCAMGSVTSASAQWGSSCRRQRKAGTTVHLP